MIDNKFKTECISSIVTEWEAQDMVLSIHVPVDHDKDDDITVRATDGAIEDIAEIAGWAIAMLNASLPEDGQFDNETLCDVFADGLSLWQKWQKWQNNGKD